MSFRCYVVASLACAVGLTTSSEALAEGKCDAKPVTVLDAVSRKPVMNVDRAGCDLGEATAPAAPAYTPSQRALRDVLTALIARGGLSKESEAKWAELVRAMRSTPAFDERKSILDVLWEAQRIADQRAEGARQRLARARAAVASARAKGSALQSSAQKELDAAEEDAKKAEDASKERRRRAADNIQKLLDIIRSIS